MITTRAGPCRASTTPARAGPTRLAAPVVQPHMTFAAVSSSAVRTTAGKRAAWAGRVTVKARAVSGARTKT